MTRCVASYGRDLKDSFFVVDDGELDEDMRVLGAGAIFYGLAAGDLLPDTLGPLGIIDDVLVLRIALERICAHNPERAKVYAKERPELFGSMAADLATARSFLGELFELFDERVDTCRAIEFKGKTPANCVSDPEDSRWLYDEVMEAQLHMPSDEEDIARHMRKIDTVMPRLRQRLAQKKR
ncbi:MAG: hypothetical protein IT379_07820 [Deltaproteobacteria bacterium]|nr:hypothetical protein [Deltaproteobacteria bacterium]